VSTFILHLETSESLCSVSLGLDGILLSSIESKEINDHSKQVTLLISDLLNQNNFKLESIQAIAISSGPGSYTGLRVATSAAKAICFALNIPLIAVNTLHSLAYKANMALKQDAIYVPMIDARRMEVYTAVYDSEMNLLVEPHARIIDQFNYETLLEGITLPIVLCGSGLAKCLDTIKMTSGTVKLEIVSHAVNLVGPAYQKFLKSSFEDITTFKPF
jgi:tRNA threonylcarbamoyladenosine biosynthesis protein TsaB